MLLQPVGLAARQAAGPICCIRAALQPDRRSVAFLFATGQLPALQPGCPIATNLFWVELT